MGITKKRKAIAAKVDKNKVYTLGDASSLVKEVSDLEHRLVNDCANSRTEVRTTTWKESWVACRVGLIEVFKRKQGM